MIDLAQLVSYLTGENNMQKIIMLILGEDGSISPPRELRDALARRRKTLVGITSSYPRSARRGMLRRAVVFHLFCSPAFQVASTM